MAASLAAEPIGLGKPHSGFTIVPPPLLPLPPPPLLPPPPPPPPPAPTSPPPPPAAHEEGIDDDGDIKEEEEGEVSLIFGMKTSFHTREYLGRRARNEGGDTR